MKKKPPALFGDAVRDARKTEGLTQTKLADLADVPHGQVGVSDIERGRLHAGAFALYERLHAALPTLTRR